MAKIKKEELEKVQELNSKLGSIKMALGDAYIVKINVDNRLEQLPKEFQEVQSEFDEFTLLEQPNSLFANYWSEYISNIYDVSSRIFTMSAFLPTHILTNLKLNDIVVIGNRKYRINKLEVNLNNGKAKLELFNDLGYYD